MQDFAIPEAKLVQLAQELFAKESGVSDDTLLADDFRFEFPIVSLDKKVGLHRFQACHATHLRFFLLVVRRTKRSQMESCCVLQAYLKAVRSFGLKDAFPGERTCTAVTASRFCFRCDTHGPHLAMCCSVDLDPHPYDWRVDKYERSRVW